MLFVGCLFGIADSIHYLPNPQYARRRGLAYPHGLASHFRWLVNFSEFSRIFRAHRSHLFRSRRRVVVALEISLLLMLASSLLRRLLCNLR